MENVQLWVPGFHPLKDGPIGRLITERDYLDFFNLSPRS
jgi:hypothetical protein